MQTTQITAIDIGRMFAIALSVLLMAMLVALVLVGTLGLGFESHAGHGPIPAPLALEVR